MYIYIYMYTERERERVTCLYRVCPVFRDTDASTGATHKTGALYTLLKVIINIYIYIYTRTYHVYIYIYIHIHVCTCICIYIPVGQKNAPAYAVNKMTGDGAMTNTETQHSLHAYPETPRLKNNEYRDSSSTSQ